MNLIGRVVHRGAKGSGFNQHLYVMIAYDKETDSCLIVNFTTKRGKQTPVLTIEVKKEEFPSILTADIFVVEYGKAEEISLAEFKECGIKKDSYGNDKVCPEPLLRRIIAQINAGSEMKDKFIKKYFPNSPILK